VLFAIPAMTVQYPVFAGNFLGMADGPTLRPESSGRHRLPTPVGTWNITHAKDRDLSCSIELVHNVNIRLNVELLTATLSLQC